MRKLLIAPFTGIIYLYKYLISPLLPRGCRHYPSCSEYSITALKNYGIITGGVLSINRISRCQPWGTSGYDPVPRVMVKRAGFQKRSFQGRKRYLSCNRLKHH